METCFVMSKAYGQIQMNNSNKEGSVNDKESVMNCYIFMEYDNNINRLTIS